MLHADHRRRTAGTLAGAAMLAAVTTTGAATHASAAAHLGSTMPRFVAAEGRQIVVVDLDGVTTVYDRDGERAWSSTTAPQDLSWPVDGDVTSEFGPRWGRQHRGIDISAAIGTPIHAASGGRVTFAGWKQGYGLTVDIAHGDGIATRYAHQSELHVSEDDLVSEGEKIGAVGNTGVSTGPHLHFEVSSDGQEQDPREELAADEELAAGEERASGA